MRRLLRYVGQPASPSRDSRAPRTGRYLDLTFAADVRAFAVGRSRRVLAQHGELLAVRRVARRDQRYLWPVAFGPPCSHARARTGRHSRTTLEAQASDVDRPWSSDQPSLGGSRVRRAGSRLTRGRARVSSRSGRQPAECRAKAHSPSAEGAPNLVERGARSRALRTKRAWSSATGDRRKARPRQRAPGASDAARASTKPEEDAGAVTRPGGRSGQHAVKRAAHARRVSRQADPRGEVPGAL